MGVVKTGQFGGSMKHLLDTAKLADAYFLVGDGKELLSAHKIILVSASEVFEAMFRFDSQNGKAENEIINYFFAFASVDNPVEVPDVEAAAFKGMLSFIYADDLSELNGDNAMAVLCAADKYGIDGLISHCVQIPIQNLPNVFLAHAKARLFNFEDFSNKCLRYICQNATTLFHSEEFLQIDQNFLCEMFERDQLVVSSEFELWQAALRWADEKCRQNAIECSAENRRDALGSALFEIRFPLILTKDFTKSIGFANCPVVEVPDVGAAAFKVMLSFIYMEDLNELNGDNAIAVLYAAKKYNIPDLVLPSLQIPISELRNVFFAFAQARLFDLEDYVNNCLAYIDKNADICSNLMHFYKLTRKF
ncbi:hypothetical protein niasHT_032741 [Heterodera trifolii]|uniref:BTB domain-containing protein n=1 Tax=Heterodera trifolii TaxID=157864 RepID=A0ABD2IKG8_9BILA